MPGLKTRAPSWRRLFASREVLKEDLRLDGAHAGRPDLRTGPYGSTQFMSWVAKQRKDSCAHRILNHMLARPLAMSGTSAARHNGRPSSHVQHAAPSHPCVASSPPTALATPRVPGRLRSRAR